ncbi:phospholipase A2 A2-actitoxin-Cgg2a-like [Orbicella faveolata]|uniref:phospholipase A2 A2-actitoxin-Cgg2a-like n=1 Tax=Orbicella faveolata TaxID=48498 RepID=UPI0009E42304|nr:phospholipase A2 A2-actitoxin-Cgg2a-like [Orbicella faveolata]
MIARFILVLVLTDLTFLLAESVEIDNCNKEVSAGDKNFVSTKRGVIEFGIMIGCATRRSAFDYIGYGCWCGIGGKGTPVDNVDRCCRSHDLCYENTKASNVCPFNLATYLMPYSTESCTICEPASYYWFWGKCRNALCECDATAAKCFASNPYHEKYKGYPQSKC